MPYSFLSRGAQYIRGGQGRTSAQQGMSSFLEVPRGDNAPASAMGTDGGLAEAQHTLLNKTKNRPCHWPIARYISVRGDRCKLQTATWV